MTDANIVLGRLEARNFGDVGVKLDRGLAEAAVRALADRLGVSVEQASLGVLDVATANMADAVRAVTVKRGLDPRDFDLLAYGGAGALHAVAVARELGCRRVHIPRGSGVFSAVGMLSANLRHDVVQSCFIPLDGDVSYAALEELSALMAREASEELEQLSGAGSALAVARSADMRYVGQEHTLSVTIPDAGRLPALKAAFDDAHGVMFAHSAPEELAEVVSIRVSVSRATGASSELSGADGAAGVALPEGTRPVVFEQFDTPIETPVWLRNRIPIGQKIPGPCVIEDVGTSVLVWPSSTVHRTPDDILTITLDARS